MMIYWCNCSLKAIDFYWHCNCKVTIILSVDRLYIDLYWAQEKVFSRPFFTVFITITRRLWRNLSWPLREVANVTHYWLAYITIFQQVKPFSKCPEGHYIAWICDLLCHRRTCNLWSVVCTNTRHLHCHTNNRANVILICDLNALKGV